MNTYNMPEEPTGPVWDKDGHRWELMESGVWLRDGATWTTSEWHRLLHRDGPLTDTPPSVKVGEQVTLTEFSKMPEASIAGGPWDVYIRYNERVFTDAQEGAVDRSESGDDVVTVLRVGGDEE